MKREVNPLFLCPFAQKAGLFLANVYTPAALIFVAVKPHFNYIIGYIQAVFIAHFRKAFGVSRRTEFRHFSAPPCF